jgi:PAS domain-containing protein
VKAFLSSLAETTKRLSFGIIVHNLTDASTFSIKKGEVTESEIPETLSGYLLDDACHCAYFSHDEKVVVIYFVRFVLKKQRLVVIIQDTKQRVRVNKFISALINSSYGSAGSALSEEFLKNFEIERKEYEYRLQKLSEDTLFEKTVRQKEKDELEAIIKEMKGDLDNYKISSLWDKAREEEFEAAKEAAAKLSGVELKYDSLVREMWAVRNDLDDARRENLALSGEVASLKAYGEAKTEEDKENAAKEELDALKNENIALRREIKEYQEIIAKKDEQIEQQAKETSKQKSYDTAAQESYNEIKELKRELEKLSARYLELEKLNEKLKEDFNHRGDLLEECRKELSDAQKELLRKDGDFKKLDALKEEAESALEQTKYDAETQKNSYERELSRLAARISDMEARSVALLEELHSEQTLRGEFQEIFDGIVPPILAIDEDDKVLYANKALEAFGGKTGKVLTGALCYEAAFNSSSRCEWCLAEQVRQNEEPAQVKLSSDDGGRTLEITFFPIMDIDGTVVKVAEIITDRTEINELNASLSKTKEKLKELKAQKTEDVNKINELDTAFQELSEEYNNTLGRNNKMIKVIERLVTEDKAKELINARMDITELRNKLFRANDMIKNYKYQLDEQLIKYSNLNRRTFMQIERLFNTVKGKTSLKGEESVAVLSFLSREFERVRKQFIDEEKTLREKKEDEPSFESVEEQMLKEKFAAKLGDK